MAFLKATFALCFKPRNTTILRTLAKCSSQFSISRFPVPEKSSLPKDIQDRMNDVEEKRKDQIMAAPNDEMLDLANEIKEVITAQLTEIMSSVGSCDTDDLTEALEESGFLPNAFMALAHRPEEFRAFFNYYDAIMEKESGLSKAEKELIVVATSSANNCIYCIIAHGALHRFFSKRPLVADQLAANWQCADTTSREKAILSFAMKIARAEPVDDIEFQNLEREGISKEDAWDIGAIAAFFALSNRMAHLTNMRPNDEFYTMGREKREKKE